MPITSRVLEHIRPQASGVVKAQERLIDHLGRKWFHSVRGASEAALTTAMNARDLTEQLKDTEEQAAVEFIRNGGSPGDFINVDLTNTEYNRRLAKRFASISFEADPDFLINMAVYILTFTVTQIENALSTTTVKAQKVLDRATDIQTDLAAALVADAANVQEDFG